MTLSRRVGFILSLAFLLGACGASQTAGQAGAAIREEIVDGVRLWAHANRGDGGGLDALIAGTVGYDADARCLYLEDGGLRYPVIWPYDAEIVSGDPLTISAGGASGITVGTYVEGGGGYHGASTFDVNIPDGCLGPYEEVAQFNQRERITASTPDE